MMRWHRLCAMVAGLLLAYVVLTGAGIEFADMRALVTHAPATDPDMLMMRQHIYGPPNYAVVSAPDYSAPALPADLDTVAAIHTASQLGRASSPQAELRLVELRMVRGKVAGHVQMGGRHLMFDLATGDALPAELLPPPEPPRDFQSTRSSFKFFHRFNYLGQLGTALNGLAGVALSIMVITGLTHYVRLYRARAKQGRRSLLWQAGDWWRNLHRWASVVAGVFIVWLMVSGLALSMDNLGAFVSGLPHFRTPGPRPSGPDPFDGDLSSPLDDSELAGMTQVTLGAFHQVMPATALKVLRLRYFSGYPQGVVVAADAGTTQLVFNSKSGVRMSMSEKGYPYLGFPAGWEWHQRLKQIHRGDILGMPGRWLDSLGALSALYLVLSGSVMYWQLWDRRRRTGRGALIWK